MLSFILMCSVAIGIITYQHEMAHLEQVLIDFASHKTQLFKNEIDNETETLVGVNSGLSHVEALLKPFAGNDRRVLLDNALPVFAEIRKNTHIAHMYFIKPDGTVLLRVHKPEQSGDRLRRKTFLRAVETNAPSSGLEIGLNFFSLRCVSPVVFEGRLIGYIEVAEDIDHVFDNIKKNTSDDMALFLKNNYLHTHPIPGMDAGLGNFTVACATNKELFSQIALTLPAFPDIPSQYRIVKRKVHGETIAVAVTRLRDAAGVEVGYLVSSKNINNFYSSIWSRVLSESGLICAILLAASAVLLVSIKISMNLFYSLHDHMLEVTRTWRLSDRVEIHSTDEIGALARAFNAMLSELEQRQLTLVESETRHRAMIANISDVIAIIGRDGINRYQSPNVAKRFGWQATDLIGAGFLDNVHPEDLEQMRATLDWLAAEPELPTRGECRYRLRNGSYEWIGFTGVNLLHNKDIGGILLNYHNISGLRLMMDELRFGQRRMEDVIDFLPDATLAIDTDKRIVIWNRAMEQMTGINACDMIGKGDHEYSIPFYGERRPHLMELLLEDDPHLEARYARLDREEDSLTAEAFCGALYDGRGAHILIKGSPLHDQNGNVVGAIESIRDISELKQAEYALRESEQRYKGIANNLPGIVFQLYLKYDGDLGFNYLSDRADGIFGIGYDLQDLFARFCDNIAKDDRENFNLSLEAAIFAAGDWEFEGKYIRPDGETMYVKIVSQCTRMPEQLLYNGIILNITDRWQAQVRVGELAFFDQLTGLPNRALLLDRLRQVITASSRSGSHGALLFIDLDNFKTLNDTLGHDMGDQLLQQVAQRLTACLRAEDTSARFGGDEFVVMLTNLSADLITSASQAELVGNKILSDLNRPYRLKEITYTSTASIGVTLFCGNRTKIEVLLRQADIAMYKSKDSGRNAMHFFDPDMENVVMKRAVLEKDLREAIRQGQFQLYYQGQMDGTRLTGVEALIRWMHPTRGMVSPLEFIPLAEETRLILPLGKWVLETACAQLSAWAGNPETSRFTIAVNISAHQFHHAEFVAQVLEILERTGADPGRLKLELTESLLVTKIDEVIEKMFALKARGIGFSLDDFGTGYSSLSYLKRLPLDQLKIDQSFVRDVLVDANDASISKTVIALAQNLGLGVIAEGVETPEQRDFLARSGCEAYQGFLFSRPLPVERFEELARRLDRCEGSVEVQQVVGEVAVRGSEGIRSSGEPSSESA